MHPMIGWFEYKGRSINQLKKMLDDITVKPRSEYVTPTDWTMINNIYTKNILEDDL